MCNNMVFFKYVAECERIPQRTQMTKRIYRAESALLMEISKIHEDLEVRF